ncbi:hypothetical protein F2Q70_00030419 [Brassica cretica]|nr:hypothetical protein F2Q70_00030419 [Brassica cretica]
MYVAGHSCPNKVASSDPRHTGPWPITPHNIALGRNMASARPNGSDSNHGSIPNDEISITIGKIGDVKQNLAQYQAEL